MEAETKQVRYTCRHVATDSYCGVEHRDWLTPWFCKMRHYRHLDKWEEVEIQRGFYKKGKVRIVDHPFAGLVVEVTFFKTSSDDN